MTFIFKNMNNTKTLTLYLKKLANKAKNKDVYELIPTKVQATFVSINHDRTRVKYEFTHPYTKQKTVGNLPTMIW